MPCTTTLMFCTDCLIVLANADYSALEDDARIAQVNDGFARLALKGHPSPGDSANDEEFAIYPCACCRSPLAGSRHEVILFLSACSEVA